jgi:AraC-like DNA-binding protein
VPIRTLRDMRANDFAALRERCQILIDQHYRDPRVGPTWLARELYVSRRQLDRAFLDHPSVAEIIARRRLRQVVVVSAMNPSAPMSEIARRCGYGTYETFRAQCHRFLQCSPREARNVRMRTLAPASAAA